MPLRNRGSGTGGSYTRGGCPRDNDAREWRAGNQCAGPIRRPGSYTRGGCPSRDNAAGEWRARNQCAGPIRRPGSRTRGARASGTDEALMRAVSALA